MNAAANVGWSNDPRGARHWAHIFAPQTSHEGGTVKGRPSLTRRSRPLYLTRPPTACRRSSRRWTTNWSRCWSPPRADRDQRGDQPYSIAVMPLWSFHSLRNACIVLRFGLDPVAPGNDVAQSDGRTGGNGIMQNRPRARPREAPNLKSKTHTLAPNQSDRGRHSCRAPRGGGRVRSPKYRSYRLSNGC